MKTECAGQEATQSTDIRPAVISLIAPSKKGYSTRGPLRFHLHPSLQDGKVCVSEGNGIGSSRIHDDRL
jgi:hypothetical protein